MRPTSGGSGGTPPLPPPGWYPDPSDPAMQRYFDGHNWTSHCVPAPAPPFSAQPTPPGWYPDPSGYAGQRYFDGHNWTSQRSPAEQRTVRLQQKKPESQSFSVDREASNRRKARLESYLSDEVWNPRHGFICQSGPDCHSSAAKCGASFYEAQGHMVGPYYDMEVGGRPFRVVVLPMETGEPKQHRTIDQRTKDVLDSAELSFGQRNPHMKGVTFALRLAFGLPVDEDVEHIRLDDGSRVHLFETYAMTNLLLCSAVDEGTMKSRSTSIMRRSCARHMRATIGILQPTLVISQGAGLRPTLEATLGVRKAVTDDVALCDLDGNQFVWVSLRHPSRGNWHSLKCAYLHEVVVPAITAGRQLALRQM